MRKTYVTAFMMLLVGFASIRLYPQSSITFYPKISYDMPGKHSSDIGGEVTNTNTSGGLTVGLEILSKKFYNFNFGGGLMRLFPRSLKVDNYQAFYFIPVYGIIKYNCITVSNTTLSAIGNIGYNGIFSASDNYVTGTPVDNFNVQGGIYYAGGARIEKDIFFIEGLFKYYSGKVPNYSIKVHYTTISISFGVAL